VETSPGHTAMTRPPSAAYMQREEKGGWVAWGGVGSGGFAVGWWGCGGGVGGGGVG